MDVKSIKGRVHTLLQGFDSFLTSLVPKNPLLGSMEMSTNEWPKDDVALNAELQARVEKLIRPGAQDFQVV